MSHISTYEVTISDIKLFCQVAQKAGAEVQFAADGTLNVKQFGSNVVEDCSAEVKLPGWNYPLGIKSNGEILYDNWGSEIDSMKTLGHVLQDYNFEVIMKNVSMDMVLGNDPVEFITNKTHNDGTREIIIAL
jgi:hypothetical protein